jgi:hypothetical protein
MGLGMNASQVDQLMSAIDSDGDGAIDYMELLTALEEEDAELQGKEPAAIEDGRQGGGSAGPPRGVGVPGAWRQRLGATPQAAAIAAAMAEFDAVSPFSPAASTPTDEPTMQPTAAAETPTTSGSERQVSSPGSRGGGLGALMDAVELDSELSPMDASSAVAPQAPAAGWRGTSPSSQSGPGENASETSPAATEGRRLSSVTEATGRLQAMQAALLHAEQEIADAQARAQAWSTKAAAAKSQGVEMERQLEHRRQKLATLEAEEHAWLRQHSQSLGSSQTRTPPQLSPPPPSQGAAGASSSSAEGGSGSSTRSVGVQVLGSGMPSYKEALEKAAAAAEESCAQTRLKAAAEVCVHRPLRPFALHPLPPLAPPRIGGDIAAAQVQQQTKLRLRAERHVSISQRKLKTVVGLCSQLGAQVAQLRQEQTQLRGWAEQLHEQQRVGLARGVPCIRLKGWLLSHRGRS